MTTPLLDRLTDEQREELQRSVEAMLAHMSEDWSGEPPEWYDLDFIRDAGDGVDGDMRGKIDALTDGSAAYIAAASPDKVLSLLSESRVLAARVEELTKQLHTAQEAAGYDG